MQIGEVQLYHAYIKYSNGSIKLIASHAQIGFKVIQYSIAFNNANQNRNQ
jgi:hypothetical protein